MKRNKTVLRLTEGQLHRVIKESVKRVLKEFKNDSTELYNTYKDDYLSKGEDESSAKYHAREDTRYEMQRERLEDFAHRVRNREYDFPESDEEW